MSSVERLIDMVATFEPNGVPERCTAEIDDGLVWIRNSRGRLLACMNPTDFLALREELVDP